MSRSFSRFLALAAVAAIVLAPRAGLSERPLDRSADAEQIVGRILAPTIESAVRPTGGAEADERGTSRSHLAGLLVAVALPLLVVCAQLTPQGKRMRRRARSALGFETRAPPPLFS